METRPATSKEKGNEIENSEDNSQNDTPDAEKRTVHNNHIAAQIKEYDDLDLQDLPLWESFRSDFQNWTAEDFSLCTRGKVEKMREVLRRRGVYVDQKLPAILSLLEVLVEEERSTWTKEQIKEHLDRRFCFDSRDIYSYLETNGLLCDYIPGEPLRIPSPKIEPQNLCRAPSEGDPEFGKQSHRGYNPDNAWNKPGLDRALTILNKMYTEKLHTYGGENDNFDDNLKIFRELCRPDPRYGNSGFPTEQDYEQAGCHGTSSPLTEGLEH
jgi:hypothetical protein